MWIRNIQCKYVMRRKKSFIFVMNKVENPSFGTCESYSEETPISTPPPQASLNSSAPLLRSLLTWVINYDWGVAKLTPVSQRSGWSFSHYTYAPLLYACVSEKGNSDRTKQKIFTHLSYYGNQSGWRTMRTFLSSLPEFKRHSEGLSHCEGYCLGLLERGTDTEVNNHNHVTEPWGSQPF